MYIEIITPESTVFAGEVNLVQLPGKDGSLELLNRHAPLVSVLKKGKIRLVDKDKKVTLIEVKGGVAEVRKNKVIILAE